MATGRFLARVTARALRRPLDNLPAYRGHHEAAVSRALVWRAADWPQTGDALQREETQGAGAGRLRPDADWSQLESSKGAQAAVWHSLARCVVFGSW